MVPRSVPMEYRRSARPTVEGWRYLPSRKCYLGREAVARSRCRSSSAPGSWCLQKLAPPKNLQIITCLHARVTATSSSLPSFSTNVPLGNRDEIPKPNEDSFVDNVVAQYTKIL